MKNLGSFILLIMLSMGLIGCVQNEVSIKNNENPNSMKKPLHVSKVKVENNQIKVSGSGLDQVTELQLKNEGGVIHLEMESRSSSEIIANGLGHITFTIGKVIDIIFASAHAASTFRIDFSLCDATLNGHGFNCSVVPNDKEVMSFDAASGTWRPRAVNGLSYKGVWDANDSFPTVPRMVITIL